MHGWLWLPSGVSYAQVSGPTFGPWIWGQQLSAEKHPKLLAASHAASIPTKSWIIVAWPNLFRTSSNALRKMRLGAFSLCSQCHWSITYRVSSPAHVYVVQPCPITKTLPLLRTKQNTSKEFTTWGANITTLSHLKHSGSNQGGCGRCCPAADCRASQANKAAALSGHSSSAKGSWGAKDAALKAPSNLRSDGI